MEKPGPKVASESHLSLGVSNDAINPVTDLQKNVESEVSKQRHEHVELTRTGSNGAEFTIDEDEKVASTARFSMAQLKVKIAQAKHDTKLAADAELLAAKKEIMEWRYKVADRERERDKAVVDCEALQKRLDAVLLEHKKTWPGMRDDLQLEKLLATLDTEKATREKLQEAYMMQHQALSLAQERVEKLDLQVAKYQKTETVLAQSVAHLQHRFASKDQLRAASVEHIQRELMEQHELEMTALREELVRMQGTEKLAQDELQDIQSELKTLRESEQQALATQKQVKTLEKDLKARIKQLETEKAVLQSKAEQIQKADAQLRSQVHAQSEEISTLRQEKEALQHSNKELGEIASDLLQVAERQHAENKIGDVTDNKPKRTLAEDELYLQKRRKRLRVSLG